MTLDPVVLSVIALSVSGLAALFAGWQSWVVHQTRQDARRVHLTLSHQLMSDGMAARGRWTLSNSGHGELLDPKVTFTYAGGTRREWIGQHHGVVPGVSSQLLLFEDQDPPGPDLPVKDSEALFGDLLTATVEYSLPGESRRKRSKIAISRG